MDLTLSETDLKGGAMVISVYVKHCWKPRQIKTTFYEVKPVLQMHTRVFQVKIF